MFGNTGLCVLIFIATCITSVWTSATIKVTLLSYDNSAGLDLNGHCCDGADIAGCPIGKCDHKFELCLTDINGTKMDDCQSLTGIQDEDTSSAMNKIKSFSVNLLEEKYMLIINVTDVDTELWAPVDLFSINITRQNPARKFTASGKRKISPTSIVVLVEMSCDTFFYQDNCSVKCSSEDGCSGHYSCKAGTGEKLCLEGWTGPSCAEVIPGSAHDCSVYQDSGFVSSSWVGSLNCPGANRSFSMNLTALTYQILDDVSGYVTIDHLTTAVSGSFLNTFQSLLLANDAAEVGPVFNITEFSLRTTMRNQTWMDADVKLDGDQCSLRGERVEGYFDACHGQGTCVRYGQKKNEYYCCFHNNGNNQTQPGTTAVTTSSTSAIVTTKTTPTDVNTTSTSTSTTTEHVSTGETPTISTTGTSEEPTTNITTIENTNQTEPSTTSGSPSTTTHEPSTVGSNRTTVSTSEATSTTGSTSTSESTSEKSTYTSTSESTSVSSASLSMSTEAPTITTVSTTVTTTESTTTATTEPTTTETPSVFEPAKVYSLNLEAVDEEMDREEGTLEGVLIDAWSEANKQITELKRDSYNLTIIRIRGAIGEKGVLVIEVSYTVSITITTVNMSQLFSPTKAHLTTSVKRRYNTELYTGVSLHYVEYSFSLYIRGRPPLVDQFSEIDEYITDIWNQSSSLANCSCFNITTLASEEYIGENGEEVSRIYFFVYKDDILLGPANITQPNITSLPRYEVYPFDDVITLVRYRFTYSVNIEGEITEKDEVIIKERIQLSWNETVNVSTAINITLLRSERYIAAVNGNIITKVIYMTRSEGMTVVPVKSAGPDTTVLSDKLNVTDSRGDLFVLYTGEDYFRYSYHLGLYVMDIVDTRHDIDKFIEGLETAWKTELITTEWESRKFKLRFITVEKYIGNNSDFVDMILFFLTEDGRIVDGTQFKQLSITTLSKYIQIKKRSGEEYRLVSSFGLLEQRLHLSVFFKGVVLNQDITFLKGVLTGAWNFSISLLRRTVQIRATEEMITENGEVVTKVFYTYKENDMVVKPIIVIQHLALVEMKLTRDLVSMSRNKHERYELYAYTGSQVLVSRKYMMDLYFESQVARLDYTNLQTHLSRFLKVHLNIANSITVAIKRQEEYYGNSTKHYWRLSYILLQGTERLYPGFFKKVEVRDLAKSLDVTALNGKKYVLYQGEITSLLAYSYHFQLHFRERVSSVDWFHIQDKLEVSWRIQFNVNVTVDIHAVEEVISEEGISYWRLIYYVTETALNTQIYPGSWKLLDVTKVTLDFNNIYGTTYTVLDYSLRLWRVSSAFRLLSSTEVTDSYTSVFNSAIRSTWCGALKQKGLTPACDMFKIQLIRPQYVKLASGVSVWSMYYFLEYQGFRVTSLTWPTFDLDKFTASVSNRIPFRFYYWWDFDLSFWNFRFFLHFKSKLETKDYAKVEASILESWKKENKVSTNSTKAKVVIDSQTQVVTDTGETEWKIGYHIEVNGTVIRPEETRLVNKTSLQIDLKEKDANFEINTETSTNTTYISTENLASLYVQSKVHKEDYEKFRISLEKYYQNKTGGNSSISVILGPVEEVVTEEGKTEWKVTYAVKKDGRVIHTTSIDNTEETEFYSWFNFKSKFELHYKFHLGKGRKTHTKTSILGVNMKTKVSLTSYHEVQEKLKEAINKANPDLVWACMSCLSVKIFGQEEVVTESGETVWRLNYGVYVNGSNVDASFIVAPTSADLRKLLVFKGINGIVNGVSEVSSTETYSYLSLHELHFNKPVSERDLVYVTEAVRESWANILNVSASELEVAFKNSKEYVTLKGKSFWSWNYSVKLKSTTLTRTDLSVLEKGFLIQVKDRISAIETTRGDNYTLVAATDIIEYSKHFPLYFTVKVAEKDFVAIATHTEKVWSEEKDMNVSIDIVTQQEVIDKSGHSYWELVYFVTSKNTKEGDTLLDSRVEEHSNITSLLSEEITNMTDVNGHAYKVMTSVLDLFRADLAFTLFFSARFGKAEETQLKTFIEKTVKEQINANDSEHVMVEFLKEEEVTTGTYESIWKYLVSITYKGEILNPLSSLNGSWPFFEVNTTTGHHLTIISEENIGFYYNFRSSFSFYLEKNISISSWSEVAAGLTRAWHTFEAYKDCNCLSFDLGSIHEVVDRKGETFFKILYFMKQNQTMVDSMTSRKLSTTLLKPELKNILSVDGQSNSIVELTGEMTTRVETLFGFFLKRKVRIDHWKLMESTIRTAFVSEMMINTTEVAVSVQILRQIPFVSITGEKFWRIEYQLRRQNITLDADITSEINPTFIQTQINSNFTSQDKYIIQEVEKRELIDFRFKVELFFSAPIAQRHLVQIRQAFNESQGLSFANILILNSEELINMEGKSVWQVSVFIYYGEEYISSYIPGWGLSNGFKAINMTSLKSEIDAMKIETANGFLKVLEITAERLRYHENSLNILVKNVIKTVDTENISIALENLWINTLTVSAENKPVVTVEIARQEELVDIDGNVISRLVYFLTMDGTTLTSQDVRAQDVMTLQTTLTSHLAEHRSYEVVRETDLMLIRYESMFVLYMTSPILLQDLEEFEMRLETAWENNSASTGMRNITSRILLQEELISGKESSMEKAWKVSYTLHQYSKMVDSRTVVQLTETQVKAALAVEFKKTSRVYSSSVLSASVSKSVYRYTDLFFLHLKHRVAKEDFVKFKVALETFWETEIKNATVDVYTQEELLDVHGESIWKLSYVIMSVDQVVSSQSIVQVTADVITKTVKIMSPRGMTYEIVDVTEAVRVEEVYKLYITRKLYLRDVISFKGRVKDALANIVPDGNTTNIEVEWKGQTEYKHITREETSAWRQLFLVKMNKKYITPLNYGNLNNEEITLNFTSVKGDNYELLNGTLLSTVYARADQQFTITVIGRIKEMDKMHIQNTLQLLWNATYNASITVNIGSIEEYIGDKDATITRLSLFALNGANVIDPDTMLSPSVKNILSTLQTNSGLSYSAYTGVTAVRYQSCFTLLLRGTLGQTELSNLLNVLKKAWIYMSEGNETLEINIHKQESFVGEFGVTLTQMLYTVRYGNILSESDVDIPPPKTYIEAYTDEKSSWKLYSGKAYYRLETMYRVKVQLTSEITSEHVTVIESGILKAWKDTYAGNDACSSCTIHIVYGNTYMTYDSTEVVRVSNLAYTVTSDKETITPWQKDPPSITSLSLSINNRSNDVKVWSRGDSLYEIRYLYLSGYTSKLDKTKLKEAIHYAWGNRLGGDTNVSGEISEVQLYSDKSWNRITRIQYFVSINSSDSNVSLTTPPTSTEINDALNDTGIDRQLCGCSGLKLRKVYVKGSSVNYTAVKLALKESWTLKNNESDSLVSLLEVKLKQAESTRRRRAVPTSGLVDEQGASVTPLDYTVSVEGQEPDPMFVQPPSQADIDSSLKDVGADNCGCNPGKVDRIKLNGETKDEEKKDIADAVKDAIAKSNSDIDPSDLDVQILDVNNHDVEGKPVSDVTYAVRRKDGDDVEALTSPSEAHLAEALKAKGKSLASEAPPATKTTPPEEKEDWVIPVAVLCAIFAFIIICIIFFYFVYVKRHRKKASLKESEENVENNIHNEEHFTNPVVFNNPMYGTAREKHQTVISEGL